MGKYEIVSGLLWEYKGTEMGAFVDDKLIKNGINIGTVLNCPRNYWE